METREARVLLDTLQAHGPSLPYGAPPPAPADRALLGQAMELSQELDIVTGTLLSHDDTDPSGLGAIVFAVDGIVERDAARILPLLRGLSAQERAGLNHFGHSGLHRREVAAIGRGVTRVAQRFGAGVTRQALVRALAQVRQNLGPELPR